MKRIPKIILTSFTFYFILLSLLTIYTHYSGGDSKSIGLIELNPILNALCHTPFCRAGYQGGTDNPGAYACGRDLGGVVYRASDYLYHFTAGCWI